jgi:hypothetical protein
LARYVSISGNSGIQSASLDVRSLSQMLRINPKRIQIP